MGRPFRRYCFHLAEKLGKSLQEILALPSSEITEWMAYDTTLVEDWQKKYEFDKQKELDWEERAKMFHQLLGGKRDGNNS